MLILEKLENVISEKKKIDINFNSIILEDSSFSSKTISWILHKIVTFLVSWLKKYIMDTKLLISDYF